MPTDHQDDDKALSDLLQRIEPPKSPSQLDETILKRARQKADALREASGEYSLLAGAQWRSAIAVFSVAAVAISVSLQLFNNEELDDLVQFEDTQPPALDSLPRQLQEETAAADQVALAFEQNIAVDTDTAQSLQAPAPTGQSATAEPADLEETDPPASDAGGRADDSIQLAQSTSASPAAAPTQQGIASSALRRSVENREQAATTSTADPALLNLLSAILLTEQSAENELGDLQQRQQADLIQQLLAAFDQLSEEALNLAQEQYIGRRSAAGDSNFPDDLESALESISP